MSSVAPDRSLSSGVKQSAAAAWVGGANGMGIDSAHIASLSDCFSKATVRTRS